MSTESSTWVRKDRYYQTNGGYNVSAALTSSGWMFSAWRNPPRGMDWIERCNLGKKPAPELIAIVRSAAEARDICDRDLARLRNRL